MKYLGLDFGTKRTGVAVSDNDGRMAVVKETIEVEGQQAVIDRIKTIIEEDAIESIVVGLPVGLDGQQTEQTEIAQRFIEKLRNHVTVPVQTVDERLTTEMAKTLLAGVKNEDRDKVAAQILLQNFLDQVAAQ